MNSSFRTQRGIALVVSMVMLVAITLIGIFVMSGSHLEWLMSSNSRFQNDAEMRAEAALRDAENNLPSDPINSFLWASPDAFYNADPDPAASPDPLGGDPRTVANWSNGAFITQNATTVAPPGTVNQFLVEYMGCINTSGGSCYTPCRSCAPPCSAVGTTCIHTYQIWAHATDSKGANSIVQSTYTQTVTAVNPASGPPLPSTSSNFAEIADAQPPYP